MRRFLSLDFGYDVFGFEFSSRNEFMVVGNKALVVNNENSLPFEQLLFTEPLSPGFKHFVHQRDKALSQKLELLPPEPLILD
jgi:hypothetical protein